MTITQLRPAATCANDWCTDLEPDHLTHVSNHTGPQTVDEGEVTSAAVARMHRMGDTTNLVELLLWNRDEGGRRELLTPDEADELAHSLTHWAAQCRTAARTTTKEN